jgi:hypothetical protein
MDIFGLNFSQTQLIGSCTVGSYGYQHARVCGWQVVNISDILQQNVDYRDANNALQIFPTRNQWQADWGALNLAYKICNHAVHLSQFHRLESKNNRIHAE